MPRYFFNFASRNDVVPDRRGVDLEGLKSAHRHAMRLIEQTLSTLPYGELRQWRIEITDERHRPVLSVLFPAVTPSRRKRVGHAEPVGVDCVVGRNGGMGNA